MLIPIIIIILIQIILLHPWLYFMNGILSFYCNNSAYLTVKEKLEIFPISQSLEKNYENIKKDFLNYPHKIPTFNKMLPEFVVTKDELWKVLPLKTTGKIINSNFSYFPSLKNILPHPSIHNAFFSIMEPSCKLPPHIGPYKGYLRYHLGIIIPQENNKPFISVNKEIYYWKDGEGIMFDDMYEHYAENPTSKNRVVLFIDVIRPLKGLIDYLNRFSIFLIEINPIMKRIQRIQHESVKI